MRLIYLYIWYLDSWQMVTYGACEEKYVDTLKRNREYYRKHGYCTALVRRELRFVSYGMGQPSSGALSPID